MKVGNIVILANLGELKIYEAKPRDLEAEAGLKPDHVKLDLIHDKNYIESHKKVHDVVTDQAGRFKGGSQGKGTFTQGSIGEKHTLEQEMEEDVIRQIAEDISSIIVEKNARAYLAMPETIFKRVTEQLSSEVKAKLVKTLEKDLMKVDKTELVDLF
ncbi:MAG: host attachment protein [Sulfurovum sp.]|nr:host attachment protein [Sulfurovum sp.]